jgi:hypothetical protein
MSEVFVIKRETVNGPIYIGGVSFGPHGTHVIATDYDCCMRLSDYPTAQAVLSAVILSPRGKEPWRIVKVEIVKHNIERHEGGDAEKDN